MVGDMWYFPLSRIAPPWEEMSILCYNCLSENKTWDYHFRDIKFWVPSGLRKIFLKAWIWKRKKSKFLLDIRHDDSKTPCINIPHGAQLLENLGSQPTIQLIQYGFQPRLSVLPNLEFSQGSNSALRPESRKQPIITCYLDHVTGYQGAVNFLIRSVPT